MIIRRIRFKVKRGHFQEAVEMMKELGMARMYRTLYGPNDMLTLEQEFDSLEALAEATKARWERDAAGGYDDWYKITESSETEILMSL